MENLSKEKQIEEMSCKKCLHYEMCLDNFRESKAEGFYELIDEEEYFAHADECDFFITGYLKQSEWISVEERLPVPYADVIVYDKASGVIMDSMLSTGEFVNGLVVTHWMPLPEPPMKGGAE